MGQYIYADQKASVIAINATFCSINAAALTVRYYTRLRISRSLGADDALAAFAALFIYSGSIVTCIMTRYGLGAHQVDQLPSQYYVYERLDYFIVMAYESGAMFIKLSLLAFYVRIAPFKQFLWVVYTMMFVVAGLGVGSVLTNFLLCRPFAYTFDFTIKGECGDIRTWVWFQSSLNFATDLIVYVLPTYFLWDLKVSRRRLIALRIIFGLAAIAVVASIVRLSTVPHFTSASTDYTWDDVLPINWGDVELHVALFVSCAPSLAAFARHYRPGWLDSVIRKSSGSPEDGLPLSHKPKSTEERSQAESRISTARTATAVTLSGDDDVHMDEGDGKARFHGYAESSNASTHTAHDPGTAL